MMVGMQQPQIGFIGQGFIGKHMADNFEERGYAVTRYALEEPYVKNKAAITDCDITFIAVPTPTTPEGFDASLIRGVLPLIGKGKIAVIKSTILPGTVESLQRDFPDIYVMHSPEFLREVSAAEDTAHPDRNIVGTPDDTPEGLERAESVMAVLPVAPYSLVTTARNAECIKYIGNTFLFTKLVFMNLAHDFTAGSGADWETVREAVGHDNRIGHGHTQVIHDSGRGAGGHCFIKDFEALIEHYSSHVNDPLGLQALEALRNKNNQLLLDSEKDLDLLRGVYGDNVPH
jgi:nucleotide sugar dehydrogenase